MQKPFTPEIHAIIANTSCLKMGVIRDASLNGPAVLSTTGNVFYSYDETSGTLQIRTALPEGERDTQWKGGRAQEAPTTQSPAECRVSFRDNECGLEDLKVMGTNTRIEVYGLAIGSIFVDRTLTNGERVRPRSRLRTMSITDASIGTLGAHLLGGGSLRLGGVRIEEEMEIIAHGDLLTAMDGMSGHYRVTQIPECSDACWANALLQNNQLPTMRS